MNKKFRLSAKMKESMIALFLFMGILIFPMEALAADPYVMNYNNENRDPYIFSWGESSTDWSTTIYYDMDEYVVSGSKSHYSTYGDIYKANLDFYVEFDISDTNLLVSGDAFLSICGVEYYIGSVEKKSYDDAGEHYYIEWISPVIYFEYTGTLAPMIRIEVSVSDCNGSSIGFNDMTVNTLRNYLMISDTDIPSTDDYFNDISNSIDESTTEITNKIDTQTTDLTTALDNQTTDLTTAMDENTTSINTKINNSMGNTINTINTYSRNRFNTIDSSISSLSSDVTTINTDINNGFTDMSTSIDSQTQQVTGSIDNMSENITSGFDSTAGEAASNLFSNNASSYEQAEGNIFSSAKNDLNNFQFYDIGSNSSIVVGLSFVTSTMTAIFNAMGGLNGGAGILLSVLFSVILVSIVIGTYRYFVSSGKAGGSGSKKGGKG